MRLFKKWNHINIEIQHWNWIKWNGDWTPQEKAELFIYFDIMASVSLFVVLKFLSFFRSLQAESFTAVFKVQFTECECECVS